jgi:hypothetical protein
MSAPCADGTGWTLHHLRSLHYNGATVTNGAVGAGLEKGRGVTGAHLHSCCLSNTCALGETLDTLRDKPTPKTTHRFLVCL